MARLCVHVQVHGWLLRASRDHFAQSGAPSWFPNEGIVIDIWELGAWGRKEGCSRSLAAELKIWRFIWPIRIAITRCATHASTFAACSLQGITYRATCTAYFDVCTQCLRIWVALQGQHVGLLTSLGRVLPSWADSGWDGNSPCSSPLSPRGGEFPNENFWISVSWIWLPSVISAFLMANCNRVSLSLALLSASYLPILFYCNDVFEHNTYNPRLL
ncbi:hypothetical protein QBC44DRAFT_60949 [Cladorrhinum sp. PSN332]|nr:hypothetical protein QBC44DRAFT_60949 [Cladorrhinum sp. PSN332]